MPIGGYNLRDSTNTHLVFLSIVFAATLTLGALLYWRGKFVASQEYVDIYHPLRPSVIADDRMKGQ